MHALPITSRTTSRTALRAAGVAAVAALTLPVLSATSAFAAEGSQEATETDAQVVEVEATAVAQEVEAAAAAEQVVEKTAAEEVVEEAAAEEAVEQVETQLAPAQVLTAVQDEPTTAVGPATVLQANTTRARLVAGIAGPSSLTAGQTGSWTLTVTNVGDRAAARGLALRPVLPEGVAVSSVDAGDGFSCVLGPLVCRLDAPLGAGGDPVSLQVDLAFAPAMSGVQSVGAAVTPAAGDPADTGEAHSAAVPVTVYDALPDEPAEPVDTGAAGGPAEEEEPVVLAAPPVVVAAAPVAQAPVARTPVRPAARPARVVRPASASTAPQLTTAPRTARTTTPAASAAAAAAPGTPTSLAFTGDRTDVALPAAAVLLALGGGLVLAGRRRSTVTAR